MACDSRKPLKGTKQDGGVLAERVRSMKSKPPSRAASAHSSHCIARKSRPAAFVWRVAWWGTNGTGTWKGALSIPHRF